MQTKLIDTDVMSAHFRSRAIHPAERRLLISRLARSDQEPDLAAPTNCDGYGRVRHFKFATSEGWPANPLPIYPASRALGLDSPPHMMRAQVFQNAACNWRCWYCYVPYNLLSADPRRADWLSPDRLVELYVAEPDRPQILDLSGGSPDLVPEWVPWTMEALERAGLAKATYLWSDDNLSTTYLFDHLSRADLGRMVRYRNYGRVCCFKGFDPTSFSFNTQAAPEGFNRQFDIMRRLLKLDIDLYGYVTLTSSSTLDIGGKIASFVDRLQELAPNLPLRIVPLEVRHFTPVKPRMSDIRHRALEHQQEAIAVWNEELVKRFTPAERALDIVDVLLRR